MANWQDIDINYSDYAKQSEHEKLAFKLYELGRLILQPELNLKQLKDCLEEIQNGEPDFCKNTTKMLEVKFDGNELEFSKEKIDQIMEEIMICRVKLTRNRSDQDLPVECSSEVAYAQFINMKRVWKQNSVYDQLANEWIEPKNGEIQNFLEKFDEIDLKFKKIENLIKDVDNFSDNKIDERIEKLGEIKSKFDEVEKSCNEVLIDFRNLNCPSQLDLAILEFKFATMSQKDDWTHNLIRFNNCCTASWKELVAIISVVLGFKFDAIRDRIQETAPSSGFIFEHTLLLLFLWICALIPQVIRFVKANSNLVYVLVFGAALVCNTVVWWFTKDTFGRLVRKLPRNSNSSNGCKQIYLKIKNIQTDLDQVKRFLVSEGYIL